MRRGGWVLAIVAVVVAGAFVGGTRRTSGPPLDPRSTGPDGTRALVELVGALGGSLTVVEGAPDTTFDRAILLEDRLGRDEASALEAWVEGGGLLVVADPSSLLTPPVAGGVADELRGECTVRGLAGVGRLDVGVSSVFDVPPGASGCFTVGDDAFVVVLPTGAGTIVAVGGPDPFTNRLLDEADNAVLAGALLAVDGGRAAFVRPGLPGSGDRGLVDLIDTPVRAALAQLVVAFGVVVLWRARRLGRPVEEHQPVEIEASELTRAVGRLLAGNRRPDRAAALLRDRARRELSAPLGLPLHATVEQVTAAIVARTSLTREEAWRAVAAPVATDQDLVATAQSLVRIHEEITDDRSIPADA